MKTLLVATDFSERSDRALRRAVLLARQLPATLVLVHVIDDDQPESIVAAEREAAQGLLDSLAESLESVDGVSAEAHIIADAAFSGILRAVDEFRPQLLILGPHRRQVLRDVFMGTTAERTLRAANCPALMTNALPANRYRRSLMATDLRGESLTRLGLHGDLVLAMSEHCALLHVYDVPTSGLLNSGSVPAQELDQLWREARGQAQQGLDEFALALAKSIHVPPESLQRFVRPQQQSCAAAIMSAAAEAEADLVVLASRNQNALAKLFLGSVTAEVLKIAERDIMVLPDRMA